MKTKIAPAAYGIAACCACEHSLKLGCRTPSPIGEPFLPGTELGIGLHQGGNGAQNSPDTPGGAPRKKGEWRMKSVQRSGVLAAILVSAVARELLQPAAAQR